MIYYKYARWGSVRLSDLSNLELTAPSLYEELDISKFSLRKTMHNFSSIPPDQVQWENKTT